MDDLRQQITEFLQFKIPEQDVPFVVLEEVAEQNYTRYLIQYDGQEGDPIPAYFFVPEGEGQFPAILIHHQHSGERHFGKSELCGLVGDPYQAFAPALAKQGIAVLAPDSICFEDRRHNCTGTDPDPQDVAQHYNEMCYRLVQGDTLMRKVLDDSARSISLLQKHPQIDANRIGMLGHSYGGNTVLFHMALDERITFGCSSGAACSYQYKVDHQFGIEMAEVIPGFAAQFDIADLVKCMAPRHILIVSATEDNHAMDAPDIVEEASKTFATADVSDHLAHKRYDGGHPLTAARFDDIVAWLVTQAKRV